MSTKKTENTDETTTTTENKKIFAPLGKYAIVAMIMVSIIVTTAIMLNKQLGTVEEQLAVMEVEVAERNAAISGNTVSTEINKTTVSSSAISEAQEKAKPAEAEAAPVVVQTAETQETTVSSSAISEEQVNAKLAEAESALVQAVEAQTTEVQAAEVLVATENSNKETVSEADISTEQTSSTDVAAIEPAMSKNSADDSQTQFAMENRDQQRQARLESFKLEQKQHMTEMFARIKSLESKQLDQYKIHQDKQIERLRQQIAKQEQLIEALILRNKERVDIREASMQRSQSNREKMLNRI